MAQDGMNKDRWGESRKGGLGMPGFVLTQDKGKAKESIVEEINPKASIRVSTNLRDAEDEEPQWSGVKEQEQKYIPVDLRDAEDGEPQSFGVTNKENEGRTLGNGNPPTIREQPQLEQENQ